MLDDLPIALRWVIIILIGAALVVSSTRVSQPRHRREVAGGLYAADRESDIGHIVMLTAMLIMSVAPPNLIPNTLWRSIFTVTAAAYFVLLVTRIWRSRTRSANDGAVYTYAGAAYHLVAALAVVYTTLEAETIPAMVGMDHGHARPPLPALGWILASFFAIDAATQIVIAITLIAPGLVAGKLPATTRAAAFPHVTMDAVMALMMALSVCPTTNIM